MSIKDLFLKFKFLSLKISITFSVIKFKSNNKFSVVEKSFAIIPLIILDSPNVIIFLLADDKIASVTVDPERGNPKIKIGFKFSKSLLVCISLVNLNPFAWFLILGQL